MNHRGRVVTPVSFDLIIFDCDGTLVDSEPVSLAVLEQFVSDLGLTMSHDEVVRAFVGRAAKASLALMAKMLGRPLRCATREQNLEPRT